MTTSLVKIVSDEQAAFFHREGFLLVRALFDGNEVAELRDAQMAIFASGPVAGSFEPVPVEEAGDDLLKAYPRALHPHKYDKTAMRYLIHPKVMGVLSQLFQEEPLALESMFYFKPPGARGQALHQDNFYVRAEPGTCIAAWCSIDPADRANGGMTVVPNTNRMAIACPHEADLTVSFSNHEVDIPEGEQALPIDMEEGDVLFFNGSLIHGSGPNKTKNRFRRSFIGHYIGASTERVGDFYNDELYNYKGERVGIAGNPGSGPCGNEP